MPPATVLQPPGQAAAPCPAPEHINQASNRKNREMKDREAPFRVRIDKRGDIIIPVETREKTGPVAGETLELYLRDNEIVMRKRDLWSELRKRGKNLKVDLDEAEEEADRDEETRLETQVTATQ